MPGCQQHSTCCCAMRRSSTASGAPSRPGDVAISGGRIVAVGALARHAAPRRDRPARPGAGPGLHRRAHARRPPAAVRSGDGAQGRARASPASSPAIAASASRRSARATAVPPLNLVGRRRGAALRPFAAYFARARAAAAGDQRGRPGRPHHACAWWPWQRPRPAGRPRRDRRRCRRWSREALAAGALGVSTGTYYAPASAATADEIRAVCEPLRGSGALIASHIRDEGDRVARVDERGHARSRARSACGR